jgi:hypothetical protein
MSPMNESGLPLLIPLAEPHFVMLHACSGQVEKGDLL